MRTTTTSSGVKISYPEELAHAFNAIPIVVTDVANNKDVTLTIGEYTDTRKPYNNSVTFDISEYVALLFAADLESSHNHYSGLGSINLNGSSYNSPVSTAVAVTTNFGLSPYFKNVEFSINVGGEVFSSHFLAIWGALAYDSMLGKDYSRATMSKDYRSDVEVLVVKGGSEISLFGADGVYLKKYVVPASDDYVAIRIPVAHMQVTRIEATLAAYWAMARVDSPDTRTQTITFDRCHEVDKDSVYPIFFVDREGLSRTIPAQMIEQSYISEMTEDVQSVGALTNPDIGYNTLSPLNTMRNATYNSVERMKFTTLMRNVEELKIYRQVISSPIVYLGFPGDISMPRRRVYPVPMTIALPSKDVQGFTFEVEMPTPRSQRL